MEDSTAPLSCRVCFKRFATAEGTAFALHLASCSRSSPSPPGTPTPAAAHCPRCFHVYAAGTLAHEISFHEHECARVNELPDAVADESVASSTATGRNPKRQRNDARVEAAPSVTLFPSHCFLCGNGGRGLLHCGGNCARAAHQNCVDKLQAPTVGEPLSVAERKQAAENWKCAQCLRGLHRCQRCGFLGHEANSMRKCSVLDCGYHFHEQCLETGETAHTGFVCPRHTCATCGTQETDMRRCKSCTVCHHMTHLRCPRGAGATTGTTNNGGLDSTNLFVCPRHDAETTTSPTSSADASNSLRQRLATGDVVLVLEFNNALLPFSAKQAAPDAANHWGVVISAEETEPHGHGNQLLSVRMFADENVLVVPNQYALRMATASDFSRPADLIRHCLQRHAMVELQLRQMEGNVDEAEEKRILRVSTAAFAARLKALSVTEAQATSDAEEGLARWRRFQTLPTPRQYDGLGDAAPNYLYLDTRGCRPGQQNLDSGRATGAVTAGGDVPMTDPDTDSGSAAANGPARGSPHARTTTSRPKNVGRSPHEAETDAPVVENGMKVPDTSSCPVQDSQSCTQDTVMADTQDTQHDSDNWSPATSAAVSRASSPDFIARTHAIGSDANSSSKRPIDVIESANVKRQKLNTETAFTPTHFRGFQPGATLSSASAPATLHISPMASSARTILPQKRKQLTRKQKLLADMPQSLLENLAHEAFRYLEDADGSRFKPAAPAPTDADAFPWAARAGSFRPAFYRPTVMLGHSGLRRPGVDAVSRLLVSQDKRSIKCFVQTLEAYEDLSTCAHVGHGNKKTPSASPGFVLLDLMSLSSFRELESVVRTRLVEALGKRSRYTRDHFGMDAYQAQRWLEQQRRRKTSEQPPISLSYCAADGVRRHLELKESTKPTPKDKQKWLCFCANLCHLAVAITVPNMNTTRSTSMPVAAPQQVAGTAK